MKKMNLNQMENVQAGRPVTVDCGLSIASALIIGTGGIITAATGGIGGVLFAIGGNLVGWGFAAKDCS